MNFEERIEKISTSIILLNKTNEEMNEMNELQKVLTTNSILKITHNGAFYYHIELTYRFRRLIH